MLAEENVKRKQQKTMLKHPDLQLLLSALNYRPDLNIDSAGSL